MRIDPEALGQHRQDLAAALRGLRKSSGLTGERLAKRVGMSQSKISKMENGRVLPSVLDVERVLHALDADEDTVHELVSLARIANTEFRSWRSYQRFGLHHKQRELAAYEADATEIRFFLPQGLCVVPECSVSPVRAC